MSTSTAKDQWKLCEATKLCPGLQMLAIAKLLRNIYFRGYSGEKVAMTYETGTGLVLMGFRAKSGFHFFDTVIIIPADSSCLKLLAE